MNKIILHEINPSFHSFHKNIFTVIAEIDFYGKIDYRNNSKDQIKNNINLKQNNLKYF